MKIIKILLILFVLFSIGYSSVLETKASSRVDTYTTNVDTYVDSSQPTTEHNSSTSLRIGYNATSGKKERAILNIPATFVSGMTTIHSASLNLWMTSCTAPSVTLAIMRATSSWNGYTTWNTQPTFNGMVTRTSVCNVSHWANFYIEDIVREWVAGQPNYGLVINGPESGSTTWWREFSSEDSSYAPQLVVNYTYTPTIPVASNVAVSSITKTEATITWNTNIESSSPVALNTNSNPYYDWEGANNHGTSHTVKITGLSPGIQYTFRLPYYEQIEKTTYYYTDWRSFTTTSDTQVATNPSTSTNPPSTNESPSTHTGSTSRQSTSTSTTSTATKTKDVVKAVDTSIPTPIFEYALKNDQKITPSENLTIESLKTDKLNIVGKSFAGAKLVLTAGEKAFTTTSVTDGGWQINFAGSELAKGEYDIKIQAQDEQKKLGSKEVVIFKLLIGEDSQDLITLRRETQKNNSNWFIKLPQWQRYLLYWGALVLLVGLFIGVYSFIKKLKSKKSSIVRKKGNQK